MTGGGHRAQKGDGEVPAEPRESNGRVKARPEATSPTYPFPQDDAVLAACVALGKAALEAREVGLVANAIVRSAMDLVGADQATLGLIQNGEVVILAAHTRAATPIGTRFPLGYGIAGWVASTGEALEVPDLEAEPRFVAVPAPVPRAMVAVPLTTGGRCEGVLHLSAWKKAAFGVGLARRLAPFADMAAQFLRHADEDQARESRLQALEVDVSSAMAEALHDLKTPLHSMLGYLDVVLAGHAGELNAEQRGFLDTAREQGSLVESEARRLLTLAVDSARTETVRVAATAYELAEEAVALVQGEALAKDVHVSVARPREGAELWVERLGVVAVFARLLENALAVAPAGSDISIRITVQPGWVTWLLADRGSGLPQDPRELFERMEGGNELGEPPSKGGLGLWLARRKVQQHGGTITAANRPGGGAIFIVRLPTSGTTEEDHHQNGVASRARS